MISAVLGDITTVPTQAIVNSANPSLLAGSGVCGAIHRVAGPELEAACRQIGRIDPGQAVLTEAFDLPAKYVIHAVAPRYLDGSRGEVEVLAETYRSICGLVGQHGITTLSMPSIGTGIYRFPLQLASQTAVRTLLDYSKSGCSMTFICFDELTLATFHEVISLEA
jgi:O-acetyl-ADP-ribose deacetylase